MTTRSYLIPLHAIRAQRAFTLNHTASVRNRALDVYQKIVTMGIRIPLPNGEVITAFTLMLSEKPEHQGARKALLLASAIIADLDPTYFEQIVDEVIAAKTTQNAARIYQLSQVAKGTRRVTPVARSLQPLMLV